METNAQNTSAPIVDERDSSKVKSGQRVGRLSHRRIRTLLVRVSEIILCVRRRLTNQMDDIWYYAEGEKSVGPLSLSDMTFILSRVSDGRNVFVWREGFSSWIKAESVPDLIPYVIKSPTSAVLLPRGLQESKAAPTSLAVANEVRGKAEPSENNYRDPVGIGGWLILVAIGQVLGPLKFVDFLFKYYVHINGDFWAEFPITFFGEAVLNSWVVAIMGCTTYFFFTKSKLFPAFFIFECVSYISLSPLLIVFKEVILNAYTGQWIPVGLEPKPIGEWIATIILAAIWLSYVKLSKRVANTFRR